jgi:LysR family transcriptional regulator of abg operon
MKLHQLQALVASADHGSIRAAARALGISQAAVTRALRELEVAENLPLLIRAPSGLSFTEFGAALLTHARLVLNQLEHARHQLSEMRGRAQGRLCVGVTPWIVHTFLPETVLEFRRRMPSVRLELYESLMAISQPLLRDGSMDFLIGFLSSPGSEFVAEPLLTYETAVLVRRGHPRQACRSIHDLLDQDWALNSAPDGYDTLMEDMFHRFGARIDPNRIVQTQSWSIMQSLIEDADMCTCGPAVLSHIPSFQERLAIVPIVEPLEPRQLSIITRGSQTRSTAAECFIDCLRRVMQRHLQFSNKFINPLLMTLTLPKI